jgi:hypothetical protein
MPQPTNPAIAKTSKSPQTHENQGVSTIFTDDWRTVDVLNDDAAIVLKDRTAAIHFASPVAKEDYFLSIVCGDIPNVRLKLRLK